MEILEKIRSDMNFARKNGEKDKVIKLSTLIGEIQKREATKGSKVNDQDVYSVIKQFINNLQENIETLNKVNSDVSGFKWEVVLYSSYLPKEMSTKEIEDFLINSSFDKDNSKAFSILMASLKEYAKENNVLYNGKTASEIAKKLLGAK